eukprot:jgi/Chrzof1/9929/Cz04g21030.t1
MNLPATCIPSYPASFLQGELNDFMALGRTAWTEARSTLTRLLSCTEPLIRDNVELRQSSIIPMSDVVMQLPMRIGDYTDFYTSKFHAFNCGCMFRKPEEALQPNWHHLPVGYHGRASSIIPSGMTVHRPRGQKLPAGATTPVLEASATLDYELEMGGYAAAACDNLSAFVRAAFAAAAAAAAVVITDAVLLVGGCIRHA